MTPPSPYDGDTSPASLGREDAWLDLDGLVRRRMERLVGADQALRQALVVVMAQESVQHCRLGARPYDQKSGPISARASPSRSSTNGSMTLVADVSARCAAAIAFAAVNAFRTVAGSQGCRSASRARAQTLAVSWYSPTPIRLPERSCGRPGAVVVADGDGEGELAHGHPASRKAASIMASTTQPAISSTSRSAEPQMSFSTT
jgi:hypothetical protein